MSTLDPSPGTPVPNLSCPGTLSGFQQVTLLAPTSLTTLQNWGPNKITGNPATKWATGAYTTLGDGSKANWDGTQWVAGVAT
jgi:hypothetical protein